jgi:hypothetical protein
MLLNQLIYLIKRFCCCSARLRKNKCVKSITAAAAFVFLATLGSVCIVLYFILDLVDTANGLGENGEWYPPIALFAGCVIFLIISHDIGYTRGKRSKSQVLANADFSTSLDYLFQADRSTDSAYTHTPLNLTNNQ